MSSSTILTISLSRAISSKTVAWLATSSGDDQTMSCFETRRIARQHRLMALWISSSVGVIETCGMVSSMSTSKNGRSRKRKPPDAREPTRFLIAWSDAFVHEHRAVEQPAVVLAQLGLLLLGSVRRCPPRADTR